MKIVFLPGLDGTGLLFNELLNYIPKEIKFCVVSLDDLEGATYLEQALEVANGLKDDELLIVAESYSGRLAYGLCDILGERIKGIVFLASFISSPSLISKAASYIPLFLLSPNPISKWLLYLIGFNLQGNNRLVDSVFSSLFKSNKQKFKERLKNIARLNIPEKTYDFPTVYIKPSRDNLVSQNSIRVLQSLFINCQVITLESGHFIGQSKPEDCAKIICRTMNTLK